MPTPCRFCGEPAVVRVALSKGCACYPDDREMALCAQHENRCSPIGTIEIIEVYRTSTTGFHR